MMPSNKQNGCEYRVHFLFPEQILRIWNVIRGCGVQLVKADSIIGRIRDI